MFLARSHLVGLGGSARRRYPCDSAATPPAPALAECACVAPKLLPRLMGWSDALCGATHTGGRFIAPQTTSVHITKDFRQRKIRGRLDLLYRRIPLDRQDRRRRTDHRSGRCPGINNSGVIAGSVPQDGGANNGGRDLGAYAAAGSAPVLLADTLQTNSIGYDIPVT